MAKLTYDLYQSVDISWLAQEVCGVSTRRLQQIIQECGIPRAGHGKVRLADGVRAFVQATRVSNARNIAKKWTDDPERQQVIVWALVAHWRGLDAELKKLADC